LQPKLVKQKKTFDRNMIVILLVRAMSLELNFKNAKGQGATEYLVLLGSVLMIGLVSISLLGFFSGTSLDTQATQSKMYWSSASPIAIVDWAASGYVGNEFGEFYMKVKNTGNYPIRITKLLGDNNTSASYFWAWAAPSCGTPNSNVYLIKDFFYLAPSEEKYFAWQHVPLVSLPCNYEVITWDKPLEAWMIYFIQSSTVCRNSTADPGFLIIKTFGFEYIEYVE
jgi:hypothetical protein